VGRAREAEPREHGREHVDQHGGLGQRARRDSRAMEEERHAHELLVQRVAVLQQAVLEELLTVVGRDHDQGRVVEAELVEEREQAAQALVGVAQGGRVEVLHVRTHLWRDGLGLGRVPGA
jgi:hypothetical protein